MLAGRLRAAGRRQARAAAWGDGVLAAALTAVALVPQLQRDGFHVSELPLRQADALAVALTAGQCLPLAALCLAVVAGCFAAAQALSYPVNLASGGLFVALYSAGAHLDRFRRVLAAAATGAYVAFCVVL